MGDFMTVELRWDVGQKEFRESVKKMIAGARKDGKVIALPVEPHLDTMLLILSQVSCDGCDAVCCKISPPDGIVGIAPSEYEVLLKRCDGKGMHKTEIGAAIEMPCRFLEKGRCTVYEDRPLTCISFPVQPGATYSSGGKMIEALAVSSYCPAARKAAVQVYMMMWRIKQKVWAIGFEEANRMLSMTKM